ncbi:aspartate aminotransferase family protein [Sphingopyxis microcysteis]|uniref:aspartate aminotransferase family protein n=1 Tax=Sphingopyxis microcysteis TaxID=2484145 RepID=UPI001B2FE9DC|nr:aspartate aminotransferase family protein [Sphingopyxis microcysteis]
MISSVMPVYAPAPIAPVRGFGSWLFDENGSEWLDCIGGVAVNALGHCHPALVDALQRQSERLWHVGNGLQIPGQSQLAERLIAATFADTAFFANTGTEAIECAIKTARRHFSVKGNHERVDIVGFQGSFHGRTFAALNAAGNAAYLDGFGPPMQGFCHAAFDEVAAWEKLVASPSTAAVIVEPVQGEGGARALDPEKLRHLRRVCSRNGVLLIFDEVQCGMGRTGRLFAHQWIKDCEPDIMAIAKALGAGFPVSACLATAQAAIGMTIGSHGSTFGGNPLAMAVAIAAFDEISNAETLDTVNQRAKEFRAGLESITARYPHIVREIRGLGLLIGVQLAVVNREFINLARQQRLLITGGGDNVVRLLPALTISAQEVREVLIRFEQTCEKASELLAVDALQVAV